MFLYSLVKPRVAPELLAMLKVRRLSKPFYFLLIATDAEIMVT